MGAALSAALFGAFFTPVPGGRPTREKTFLRGMTIYSYTSRTYLVGFDLALAAAVFSVVFAFSLSDFSWAASLSLCCAP